MPATTSKGRSLFTSAQSAGRAGPGRLGTLRSSRDRPRTPSVDGLRHGAELFAPHLPALLPQCPHGELPARPCRAFEAWPGVPKVILYDNLKSAVLERQGTVIRFHPTLFEFAGRYRFEPRPVAVARGNEKGRVERAIRYIRTGFFAAREIAAIADLNA